MGSITKLAAVNRILRAAGEYPVNSLSDDGINDSNIAEAVLDDAVLRVQMEDNLNAATVTVDMTPNDDGFIFVPSNTLYIDTVGDDYDKNVDIRANKIYDLDNDTDIWTVDNLEIRRTVALSFADLPTPQQLRAMDYAAYEYQQFTVGDEMTTRMLNQISQHSRMIGRSADMRSKDRSMFGRSDSALYRMTRRTRRAW